MQSTFIMVFAIFAHRIEAWGALAYFEPFSNWKAEYVIFCSDLQE